METTKLTAFADLPTSYEGLCGILLPRPIHDGATFENAVEMVDALAGHCLNRDQEDYLSAISDHIAHWEDQNSQPLRAVSAADAVQFLLDSNGMSVRDLAALLSVSESMGYRILRGDRNLTVEHIKALCGRFKVEPQLFFD